MPLTPTSSTTPYPYVTLFESRRPALVDFNARLLRDALANLDDHCRSHDQTNQARSYHTQGQTFPHACYKSQPQITG